MEKIIKWLDNYWYHYKWQTLIALFFIFFVAVAGIQMISKTDDDVCILYAGPAEPNARQVLEMMTALQSVMTGDYNGDGKKNVQLISIQLMTEEQIQYFKEQASESGNVMLYNSATLNENRTKFSTQIFAGETVICFLDPNWYQDVYKSGGFVPFQEILGYTPPNMIDDSSMYLKDTPFAKYFTIFSEFPEDTIVCVRRMSTVTAFKNQKKEAQRYEFQLQMFRDMMGMLGHEGNEDAGT